MAGRMKIARAVAIVCALASVARADEKDKAAAEALFLAGRALMEQNKFDEACPKLAESERLSPAAGTALNLALCYEKTKRLASAWATYREVLGIAEASGDAKRVTFAREHIAQIEGRLTRLAIVVQGAGTKGLEVKRDNATIDRAQWSVPLPVD